MQESQIAGHSVRYALDGPPDGEVLAFINGLTQHSGLWEPYVDFFTSRGYRVLRFDLLGQGKSDKPALGQRFDQNWKTLEKILDDIGVEQAHVAGISFGGTVAIQFACERPERCASLIPMSCFAEMPTQLYQMGCGLYEALVQVGLPSLQRWLMPMNMSDEWLDANKEYLPEMMRKGYAVNDLFALQNLMESVTEFEPITDRLGSITCPTLILNGEFDFFTPRKCHEVLRKGISSSRLVIVQNAYHAYTLEKSDITMMLIGAFLGLVKEGKWPGDQTVWIAADDPKAEEPWFPCEGDHMRAIPLPVQKPTPMPKASAKRTAPKRPASRPETAETKQAALKSKPLESKKPSPKPKAVSPKQAALPPKPAAPKQAASQTKKVVPTKAPPPTGPAAPTTAVAPPKPEAPKQTKPQPKTVVSKQATLQSESVTSKQTTPKPKPEAPRQAAPKPKVIEPKQTTPLSDTAPKAQTEPEPEPAAPKRSAPRTAAPKTVARKRRAPTTRKKKPDAS